MSQVVSTVCRGLLTVAALALTLGFGPNAARAEPISYTLNGLVTQSTNDAVPSGSAFTGTLQFDPGLPVLGATTATEATYGYNDSAAPGPLGNLKIHVDFGANQTFDSTTGGSRTVTIDNDASLPSIIAASGTQSFDKVTFSSANGAAAPSFTMSLSDNTAKVLSGTDLSALPDLSQFPQSGTYVHLQVGAQPGPGDVFGYITGMSNTSAAPETLSVPEPSSLVIVGLGMAGLVGARRRRARPALRAAS